MKTKLTLLFSLFGIFATFAQDLEVGNVSAGYDSYDASTGEISGIYFDVLNNEGTDADAYRIAFFLVDPNDFNTNYEVHSIDVSGQSGNTINEYENIDINLYDTDGIPEGNYRLIVCADEDDDVFESDEANNCLYLTTPGNNLEYNPNNTSSINEKEVNAFNLYPTITSGTINFDVNNQVDLTVYDVSGKIYEQSTLNAGINSKNFSNLPNGVYFAVVYSSLSALETKKFIIK